MGTKNQVINRKTVQVELRKDFEDVVNMWRYKQDQTMAGFIKAALLHYINYLQEQENDHADTKNKLIKGIDK